MRQMSATIQENCTHPDFRLVVTAQEAAKMLNISDRSLYTLSAKGELPRVLIGARVCYRIETLRNWVEAAERKSSLPVT
jgi:excisionase family DNA binding protein